VLASASADVILPYFANRDCGLELKADESRVTLADRNAELAVRQLIEKRFPNHGIVGRSSARCAATRSLCGCWIRWMARSRSSPAVPLFGTLIGLLHEGKPLLLGCVHQPVLKQLLLGDGQTTTLNGTPVRMRPAPPLSAATLLTSDPLLSPALPEWHRLCRSGPARASLPGGRLATATAVPAAGERLRRHHGSAPS
jgi:myo-inositol-1(or 4)-monophosphatase